MARKRQSQTLFVYMNDMLVGTLLKASTGALIFTYDSHWLSQENARPISLSMPLTEVPYKGQIVECYFDNLLPDNELIRKRIQIRFSTPSTHCFDILSHIGRDCIGALQLLVEPKTPHEKKIKSVPLSNHTIANLLKHYKTAPLGMDREFDFRISIAGAQEKTALLWHQDKWQLPYDETPTSHIIKLPIGKIEHSGIDLSESIENEWLCLKILSAYDLPVNTAEIIFFEDVKALVVERFDRRWSNHRKSLLRLPQEDLCQVLGVPGALKYESDGGPSMQEIMQVLLGSQEAIQDREKFMKTVFLFWVIGAIDGHAKNFSVTIEPHGHYRLTPLYDVMSAYPLAAKRQLEWKKLKMAMSVKDKNRHYLWNTIQIRHWLKTAAKCQFPEAHMLAIIEEALDNMEIVIDKVTSQLPMQFPAKICDAIIYGMRQIKKRCSALNL